MVEDRQISLFSLACDKLYIGRETLAQVAAPLIRFLGEKAHPIGSIIVLLIVGLAHDRLQS